MTYGFRVTDRATQVSTYIDEAEDVVRFVDHGISGRIEVLDSGGNVLASHDRIEVPPDSPRDLAEAFTSVAGDVPFEYGDVATGKYTQGDCDVFAVALDRLFGEAGTIVGIVDPRDQDGDEIEDAPPMLLHAGLLVGDVIIDVDGVHDRDEWEASWAERGSLDCELEYLDRGSLESMQGEAMDEGEIAKAAEVARLVAIANGYEISPAREHALAA